ncbi:MAG: hypothetical protein CVU69_09010 [Deltaproteobacteria bacterium HGW-Deltaproteobacteria-4]|nr:MAG: hypothetical protein CVU69_09010 [Deltaproteobacteria bacterium HGW-Deltaproteobacteria-4]
MKKISILLCGLLLGLGSASDSRAGDLFYLSAQAGGGLLQKTPWGGSIEDTDFKVGTQAGGALGFTFPEGRIEAEVSYRQNDIEEITFEGKPFEPGGSMTALSVMLNSYADYPVTSGAAPYFMVGAGMARVTFDEELSLGISFSETEDTVFAYQGGVGVGLNITKNLVFDLGYRYFATLNPEFTSVDKVTLQFQKVELKYRSHAATAGLRYHF